MCYLPTYNAMQLNPGHYLVNAGMLWFVNPLPRGGGRLYRLQVGDTLQTGGAEQVTLVTASGS